MRDATHWGSSADCLQMDKTRHHQVAQDMIKGFRSESLGSLFRHGRVARLREAGVHVPPSIDVANGLCLEDVGVNTSMHDHHKEHMVWPH